MNVFQSSDQMVGAPFYYPVDMSLNVGPDIYFLDENFLGVPNISI
jgi:hypothetical protein